MIDEKWVEKAWHIIRNKFQDEQTLATFFLSLPQKRINWDLLDTAPQNVSTIYWQKIAPHLYQEKRDDKLYAIDKLQVANRYITLIDKVAHIAEEISSDQLADILLKAATIKSDEVIRIDSYDIGQIFKTLHGRNDLPKNQLTQLEWYYLSFLTDSYVRHKPQNLHFELTESSDFFVEVVSYVYRPDEGNEDAQCSEEELTRRYQQANSARELLDSWKDIPGVKEDGTIDKEKLKAWVSNARSKAREIHRIYGVDSQIGNMLACYPRKGEAWPPEEICELIDALNSEVVLSHFRTEIFNSRGVSVRSPYAGGGQERALATYFETAAKKIQSKYPFTASALFALAKGYERDAKDEDERAHLDELR